MLLRQEDDTCICRCDSCGLELRRDKKNALKRAQHYCDAKCVMQAVRDGKLTRRTKTINPEEARKDPRRVKRCVYCEKEYVDVTKRNVGTMCSKACANAKMVATRKANGSFTPTEEQNKRRSVAMKQKHAEGHYKDVLTPDILEKAHAALRGRKWPDHWMKSPEARKAQSDRLKGRTFSDETRAAMSRSAQNRVRNKCETLHTSAAGGHREDLGMYFRSRWEANFARVMKLQGRTWEYEPCSFQLDETTSYTPDFLVDGTTYYELKGRWYEGHAEKVAKFREKYPEAPFVLIEVREYRELSKQYKVQIPEWEGK